MSNIETIPEQTKAGAQESVRQRLLNQIMQIMREMPSDWRTMSEETQSSFIQRADFLANETLRKIIDQLATDGRNAIKVTVEALAVKDSLKLTVIAPKTSANINDVGEAQGSWAYLITYNEKNNMDRILPKAEANQVEIFNEEN